MTKTKLAVLTSSFALALMGGCADTTGPEGEWIIDDDASLGFLGDPLVGQWQGGFAASADEGELDFRFTFAPDGTYSEQATRDHLPSEPELAGCTEVITRTGGWARDDTLTLTLRDSDARVVRSGCATPADDGMSAADPATRVVPTRPYRVERSGRDGMGPSFDGLSLDGDFLGLDLHRQDVLRESVWISFEADSTMQVRATVEHTDSGPLAGCVDIHEVSGRYAAGQGVDPDSTFMDGYALDVEDLTALATTRAGCLDTSLDGVSSTDDPIALGALRFLSGFRHSAADDNELSLDFDVGIDGATSYGATRGR